MFIDYTTILKTIKEFPLCELILTNIINSKKKSQ